MEASSKTSNEALGYEIIHEDSDPSASLWRKINRNLAPFVAAAQNTVSDLYATAARAALERTERLEDLQAERKARRRLAAKAKQQG